jgi:hypothetical protein
MSNNSIDVSQRVADYLEKKYFELMKKRGRKFSQAQWCREMRVHTTSLSTWMSAKNPPDYNNCVLIANYLKDNEIFKICGFEPPTPDYPELIEISSKFALLTDTQRGYLLEGFRKMIEE